MVNSFLAALEAAYPLEKLLYCNHCGFRLTDLGLGDKIPSHCPVCGLLVRGQQDDGKDGSSRSDL